MHEDVKQTIPRYPLAVLNAPLQRISLPQLYPAIKRLIDLAITIAIGPIALIVVLLLAAFVVIDGHSPFYSQPRLGKGGRRFRLWKLRSMVPGADAMLAAHLDAHPAAKQEWERTQKLQLDPRITRVGKLMRKYSLDELPQLWNVLRGEMSLVGPRPMFPEQRASYPGSDYFSLRPGMTGLWQVTVRNRSSFAERAIYDSEYARHLSVATDVRILVLTPLVMLRGTGA